MTTDLAIRCRCGKVRGSARGVATNIGNHAVCYCDDCQAFAHFLGNAETILDEHGGTELFQMSPARLTFSTGADRLACLKLRPKGILRWYTDCCNTPIANTLPIGQLPFCSLVHSCIDTQGRSLDAAVGPIAVRVFGRFATGDRSTLPATVDRPPFTLFLRVLRMLLGWRLRGDHRRSPFFDARTLRPIASPRVLTEERAAR